MKSSSLRDLIRHKPDISPRTYRDNLIHDWFVQPEFIPILSVYKLYKIKTSILKMHIRDGVIWHESRPYNITWLSGPRSIYTSDVAILSFRYCDYLDTGYCLIKIYREDDFFNKVEFLTNEKLMEK